MATLRRRTATLGAAWLGALALVAACGPPERPAAAIAPAARVADLAVGGGISFATFSHACAAVDGGLQCWGAGHQGQLGTGELLTRSPLPVRVSGLDDVTAVAAGGEHSCAIAGGRVLCWGNNARRQLGSQQPSIAVRPQEVTGLPEPATHVAVGGRHSCAVAGGSLYCWGRGADGELGARPAESCPGRVRAEPCSAAPLRVGGVPGEISALALGEAHGCALATDSVVCWGRNGRGQLGRAAAPARSAPSRVRGLASPVEALAAGAEHTCALAGDRVSCWGANDAGQLGDGTREDRAVPVPVRGLPGGVRAIAAGRRHSCAIAAGRVYCWGDDAEGQRGGGADDAVAAVAVRNLPGEATALAAGSDLSCARLAEGRVSCWGADDFGQLGRGRGAATAGPVVTGPWDAGRIRDVDRDGRIVVVCLGDSNTERSERRPRSWCDELGARLAERDAAWRTVNRGLGGATVSDAVLRRARDQLDYALAWDAPDAVIAAFGTNDLLARVEPLGIVSAYAALRRRAGESGAAFFAATTPPVQPPEHELNAGVQAVNELMQQAFPGALVDFWSGFGAPDFRDAIHLGPEGQRRRADAALAALEAAGAPAGGS